MTRHIHVSGPNQLWGGVTIPAVHDGPILLGTDSGRVDSMLLHSGLDWTNPENVVHNRTTEERYDLAHPSVDPVGNRTAVPNRFLVLVPDPGVRFLDWKAAISFRVRVRTASLQTLRADRRRLREPVEATTLQKGLAGVGCTLPSDRTAEERGVVEPERGVGVERRGQSPWRRSPSSKVVGTAGVVVEEA